MMKNANKDLHFRLFIGLLGMNESNSMTRLYMAMKEHCSGEDGEQSADKRKENQLSAKLYTSYSKC